MLSIILLLSTYPVLPILYFVMKQQSTPKGNRILGVTLLSEYLEEVEVQNICKLFKRDLNRFTAFFAGIPIIFFIIEYFSIIFTVWIIWLFGMIIFLMWPYIKYNNRLKILKAEKQWNTESIVELVEDDTRWICGVIYYNPDDKHTMVKKRVGIGTTMNMARPAGKVVSILTALSLLIIPIVCIWLMVEQFTPLQLEVSNHQIIAEHRKVEYSINVDDIKEIKLITKRPSASKQSGINMDTLEKGSFYVDGYGNCKLCLNPENIVFLVITTQNNTYILSDDKDEKTQKIYDEVKSNGSGK